LERIEKIYPDHKIAATLESGQSFGDIAIELCTTRTATVITG